MWHIVIEVIASMNSACTTVLYLHDSNRMACHARVHQDSSLDNVVVDTLVPVLINFERPARIYIGEEKTQVFGTLL